MPKPNSGALPVGAASNVVPQADPPTPADPSLDGPATDIELGLGLAKVPSNAPTSPVDSRCTIALADDHPIFLEGLKRLLQTQFEVVGTAADGGSLVDIVSENPPDIVVTDYSMPGMTGVQAVRKLKERGIDSKVVVLTMHEDVEYALEALELGIDGYVLKRAASSELISAIKGALQGERWISPALAVDIISASKGLVQGKPPTESAPLERISSRQRHILEGLVNGKIAKEIAGELDLSRKTVEYHKYKMMEQLGVKSTAELIRFAVRNGVAS
jgi:DNA-binding NarL/FixJ family response regulator